MYKSSIKKMLTTVDVAIDGSRPWDIQVHNNRLYGRVLRSANLGLGEAYMEGWWDCKALDQLFCKILQGKLDKRFRFTLPVLLGFFSYLFHNLQSPDRAHMVAVHHYDFGNEVFEAMLDSSMQYSCAFWDGVNTLEEAQQQKMDMICRKLGLQPGMRVLDIGCGWGGLGNYMAREYGACVTGVTVSKAQIQYARVHSQGLGVRWLLEDYRSLTGTYDRIVSVGMFEHVGHKNYTAYMNTARSLLTEDGLFLLHTIGANETHRSVDPWIEKYIFKNGILPSISLLGRCIEGHFVMEDWHNFGADYDKTLMCWAEGFAKGREERKFVCSERQSRMFLYYLLSCAGAFRARDLQLWQIVLSPKGKTGGYTRP